MRKKTGTSAQGIVDARACCIHVCSPLSVWRPARQGRHRSHNAGRVRKSRLECCFSTGRTAAVSPGHKAEQPRRVEALQPRRAGAALPLESWYCLLAPTGKGRGQAPALSPRNSAAPSVGDFGEGLIEWSGETLVLSHSHSSHSLPHIQYEVCVFSGSSL